MRKEKQIRYLTAGILAVGVLALSACFLVAKKRDFSENENRYLEAFPQMSWEQIKSGTYMEDLNAYLSDHFPFRDLFMGMKTKAELIQGRKEIHGVYIGADGYLIEDYKKPENTQRIAGIFYKFGEKMKEQGIDTRLMLVPTAVEIYADKLPKYAMPGDQMETARQIWQASGISGIDCSGYLAAHKEDGALYYRTDHHWTTFGAYVGYLAYCREKGLVPVLQEQMEAQTVTEDFKGTIYSKVNDYGKKGDAITIYTNPSDELSVYYADTKETSDTLYNLEYLDQKDKYSLFLDNLHSLVEITNETADTDRELVLIKDSYANSMVPYLTHHYKKIYVFDTRSYKLGPSAFIKEHPGVTDVLILYNMNTLDADLGIGGIY